MKNSRQQAAVRMTGGSPVAGAVGSAANQSARIFHRGGKAFQVCAGLDARTLICRDLQDGQLVEFTVEEIGLDSGIVRQSAGGQLRDAPDSVRNETARRRGYLREVAKQGAGVFRRGRGLRDAIDRAAHRLGDARPPSDSTVVRWWQAFLRDGFAALMSHTDLRGGKGKPRLAPGHAEKVARAVDQCLQRPRRPVMEILDDLNTQVSVENAWALGPPARPVSRATLYRSLHNRPAIERLSAKVGAAEARRMLSLSKANPSEAPRRPLQIVQSDHGVLDVVLVDEVTGKPVGRPNMSVMICVATRMVVAWEVSLASPNEQTVLALLRQAMTGASDMRSGAGGSGADPGHLSIDTPRRLAHGQIEMVLFDRAKEFDSAAVQAACTELDIVTMFCPAYRPDNKGHIERFIGTVNRSFISSLPGTTYGSPKERLGYDAEGNATLTISALREILGRWIDTVYGLSPHQGLGGATPELVWRQCAPGRQLDSLHSDEAVARACRPSARRHVGKSGIKLFGNQRYASAELEGLRLRYGRHCEVTVRFDPMDLGHIWITHPDTRFELLVPNVDLGYAHGLTLREHDLLRKHQRAKNFNEAERVRLVTSRTALRREIEAAQADGTVRRRKAAAIAKDAGKRARVRQPQEAAPPHADNSQTLGVFRMRPRKALPGFALGRMSRLGVPAVGSSEADGADHES